MEPRERLQLIQELRKHLVSIERIYNYGWGFVFSVTLIASAFFWQYLGEESFWAKLIADGIFFFVVLIILAMFLDPDTRLKRKVAAGLSDFHKKHSADPERWEEVQTLLQQWAGRSAGKESLGGGDSDLKESAKAYCDQLLEAKLMELPSAEDQLNEQLETALEPAVPAASSALPAPAPVTPPKPAAKSARKTKKPAVDDASMPYIPLDPEPHRKLASNTGDGAKRKKRRPTTTSHGPRLALEPLMADDAAGKKGDDRS